MRKIILNLAVSLDNFIEGPNGEIDWIEFTEETGDVLNSFLEEIDTVLYGRVSYEMFGNQKPEDGLSDYENAFYGKMGMMKKYVFSSSGRVFEGNPVVVQSDIAKHMQELKQQPGKHIWLYGGAKLFTAFMELGLVDEIRIAVMPIILGAGKPMFGEISHRTKLELVTADSWGKSGVVQLIYQVIKR